jgi:hypothetical protein
MALPLEFRPMNLLQSLLRSVSTLRDTRTSRCFTRSMQASARGGLASLVIAAASLGVTASTAQIALAQDANAIVQAQGNNLWLSLQQLPAGVANGRAWIRPQRGHLAALDIQGMTALLAAAPMEFGGASLRIALPDPDGNWQHFDIAQSPMLEPALAAAYPFIKTYSGQGVEDRTATIRIDITTLGFRAQVLGHERNYAIDPVTFGDTSHYSVYDLHDLPRPLQPFVCHLHDEGPAAEMSPFDTRTLGTQLRTYRIAVAATESYTAFYGNSAANALSGVVTTINRVNQIYERDFAVRFSLVANNNLLMYITTSPYTDGNLSTMLGENQTNLTSVIGSANYDIGHVFSGLNLGGLAARPSACSAANKARGGTGLSNPTGDFWAVQYVSHEIGHQMGARHSFNAGDGAGAACESNRSSGAAYEPGSGSTIMSYRGLCGAANNLPASDAMFNQGAYEDIRAHITGAGNCAAQTATGNTLPVISGLTNRTIPANTAFSVTANATDANSDALTFSWEQRSLGPAQPLTGAGSDDNGTSPLFRVFLPSTSNTRFLPLYADVLDGTLTLGEKYPVLSRTMVMRLIVRDNRAGGGGTVFGDSTFTINAGAGPFTITSNNATGQNVNIGLNTITWNVANTNVAPINTANVRITLSTDGGTTWPVELAASTPNDGSADVIVPTIPFTNTVRIRIEAVGNVYYDVTNVNVGVNCPEVPNVTATASCSNVTVGWNLVSGAASYRVFRALATNPGSPTLLASLSSTTTSYVDNGAVAGTNYIYFVRLTTASCTGGGPLGAGVPATRLATPSISTQPTATAANEGTSASFSVVASGATGYQWRKGTTNLSNGGNVSGATSPMLTLANVQQSDAASYNCVVSNTCGNITSSSVALTVNAPGCDGIDFNQDGLFPDDADLIDFLSVLAGGACSTDPAPGCSDIDFNNDGLFPDDIDLVTFLQVLAGQPC